MDAQIPDISDQLDEEEKLISQFVSVGNLSQGPLGAVSTSKGMAASVDFRISETTKKPSVKDQAVIQDSSSLFNVS